MAKLKAHEVDRFVSKPDPRFKTILVYGPDTGLVSETALQIAKKTGVDLSDPFSLIRLDAEDAASDRDRIADEAYTVSMFGGSRVIWIKGSTQKNLIDKLQPVLDNPPEEAIILIEAGDLKPNIALRKKIEAASSAMALPCYQDEGAALEKLIDQELSEFGLAIEPGARMMLKSLLGGDRLASRGEVKKLCLYAKNNGSIGEDDIRQIVGDASSFQIDEVIDAMSLGDLEKMQSTYARLVATGTSEVAIIIAAQRHFQALHKSRAEMEKSGKPPAMVTGTWLPRLHFKRQPIVNKALSKWSLTGLQRALTRIEKCNFDIRANAALAQSLTGTTLLAIGAEAKRLR